MQKVILILFFVVMSVAAASAQYTIHNTTPGVMHKSGSGTTDAVKGAAVRGADFFIIPEGGQVQLLNNGNKKIYSSTGSGEVSVFDIMMNASTAANDHIASVAGRLNFGKKSGSEARTVFKEKGMVTRSLANYDPEASGVEMDAATLGRFIASRLMKADSVCCDSFPIRFEHSRNSGCGLSFRLENTLEHPVYFNIIKVTTDGGFAVEISRLGQPAGSYILLSQQAVSRQDFPAVAAGERHILLMAPCSYDVDKVMEETRKAMAAPELIEAQQAQLPLYAGEL